jgi:predicted nucleic acid-binding protein
MVRTAARTNVPLLTSNLVLAEVHRLVLHRVGVRAARTVLQRIEASALTRVCFATELNHRAARGWLDRLDDQKITYTDAVSFAIMEESRCSTLLWFDKGFRHRRLHPLASTALRGPPRTGTAVASAKAIDEHLRL